MIDFTFEERLSDSPVVDYVWRTHSIDSGRFLSQSTAQWEIVVMKHQGETKIAMRGAETEASIADTPADAEFFGVVFKLGAYIPQIPLEKLVNRNDLTLPGASSQRFWLGGSAWEFPTFENVECFVNRLMHQNLLVVDPVVEIMLKNHPLDLSLRTAQRRFRQATGVTYKTIQQIERAQKAYALLRQGVPILDTAFETGYFDQSHLTNALRRFMGQTPAQILIDGDDQQE